MQNDPHIIQVRVKIEEEVSVVHVCHLITGLFSKKNYVYDF